MILALPLRTLYLGNYFTIVQKGHSDFLVPTETIKNSHKSRTSFKPVVLMSERYLERRSLGKILPARRQGPGVWAILKP